MVKAVIYAPETLCANMQSSIIGSDRRPESKQGKIVRFTSRLLLVVLLFTWPFCPFGINLNHVILKHAVI